MYFLYYIPFLDIILVQSIKEKLERTEQEHSMYLKYLPECV